MESSASAPEFSVFELINQQGVGLIERVRKAEWHNGEESQPSAQLEESHMSYQPNLEEDPL